MNGGRAYGICSCRRTNKSVAGCLSQSVVKTRGAITPVRARRPPGQARRLSHPAALVCGQSSYSVEMVMNKVMVHFLLQVFEQIVVRVQQLTKFVREFQLRADVVRILGEIDRRFV